MRMLELMLGAKKKVNTDSELIRAVLGMKYMYFEFLEAFHREPREIDDLIDGIIYLELNSYFNRRASQNER